MRDRVNTRSINRIIGSRRMGIKRVGSCRTIEKRRRRIRIIATRVLEVVWIRIRK